MATKKEWTSLFETVVGRKPSPQELIKAKETGFDPGKIIDIAGATQGNFAELPQQSASVSSDKKTSEKKAWSMLALAVSGLSLLLALLTPWKLPFAAAALIGAVFAAVLLFFNWKKTKKPWPLIAFTLSVLVFAAGLGVTAYTYFNSSSQTTVGRLNKDQNKMTASKKDSGKKVKEKKKEDSDDDKEDSADINDYIDGDYQFDWTESDFLSLKVYSIHDSNRGTRIKTILKTYGKATEGRMNGDSLSLTYFNGDYSSLKEVELRFVRKDGIYSLIKATAEGLSDNTVTIKKDYRANWTQSDFDALQEAPEAPNSDLTVGSKWTDIQKQFGDPRLSDQRIVNFGDGEGFEKQLDVTYLDYSAPEGLLPYVHLDFKEKDGVYYLTHKYAKE
ncbi:hypothetical protein [Streptococcus pantholopis]|uniref:Uncharacterized protein n=1 Tax=Streptococcus pantholopis TaxID=1811193 RepID=A0A172Q780_9STRE|nr:hypothetical protein [Streptococcus pantholopis]AND79277.1 hypothetical protein A0O21_04155 [Streptococcus pantholopis]